MYTGRFILLPERGVRPTTPSNPLLRQVFDLHQNLMPLNAEMFGAASQPFALLNLGASTIDRLYVIPANGYWGAFRNSLPITPRIVVSIDPLNPAYRDAIRNRYSSKFNQTTGVRLGVLDTGCGPHSDLNIVLGRCTVTGQPATSSNDIDQHGTHVAGLAGGKGALGPCTLGLAPGVSLHAYRVFDSYGGKLGASNYAILKAMILAGL